MSIAPFTPAHAGPKPAGATGKAGAAGQAGADTALGFLAELAAAVGTVGPLGQLLATPGLALGQGTAGSSTVGSGGTPTASPAVAATTLLGTEWDVNGATAPTVAAERPSGALALAGVLAGAVPESGAGATAAASAAPESSALLAGTAGAPRSTNTAASASLSAQLTAAEARRTERAGAHGTAAGSTSMATSGSTSGSVLDRAPDSSGLIGDPAATAATPTALAGPSATDSMLTALTACADPLGTGALGSTATLTGTSAVDQQPEQTTAVLRQVFPEVTKVAATPGTHRLAITLHPEDLGEVRVTVVVRAGSVHVDVATDPANGTARTALEHGAPELRRLLEAAGADAQVRFRELGSTGSPPLGSTTDGGRQQQPHPGFAQAQAQADGNGAGRDRSAYSSSDSSGQRDAPRDAQRAARTTSPSGDPLPPTDPTDRRATSGVDRLI